MCDKTLQTLLQHQKLSRDQRPAIKIGNSKSLE